ncbi:MAG: hypothetical protein H6772_02395 [Pseudomonadales bacterium]|nr:hypothetical protein [Pseudomonadales bacterium]
MNTYDQYSPNQEEVEAWTNKVISLDILSDEQKEEIKRLREKNGWEDLPQELAEIIYKFIPYSFDLLSFSRFVNLYLDANDQERDKAKELILSLDNVKMTRKQAFDFVIFTLDGSISEAVEKIRSGQPIYS